MIKLDWKYIAGFMDGEGSIVIYSNRNLVSITISNTNREVLERIKDFTKMGHIYLDNRINRPVVWKQEYSYQIVAYKDVRMFLCKIKDYAIVKKEKVERAIVFIDSCPRRKFRTELDSVKVRKVYSKLNSLIKTGEYFGVSKQTIKRRLIE
jgi:intein/homing endonuclease